jgi:hypothetical protein
MFDVKKHLIKVQGGRQYLPVAARLLWFRSEHPDWGIETKAISIDVEKQYAIFESTVYDEQGKLMAKGTKMENIRGFGDWLEKAETGAIGRALAVCGYGTQFAPDLDESHGESYSDSSISSDTPNRYDSRPSYINQFASGQNYQPSTSRSPREASTDALAIVSNEPDLAGSGEHLAPNSSNSDACEGCGTVLRPSQLSLSVRKYGSALCPECQKKRKSEEAA